MDQIWEGFYLDILKALLSASPPALLLIFGAFFVAVALIGKFRDWFSLGSRERALNAIAGILFVCGGVYLSDRHSSSTPAVVPDKDQSSRVGPAMQAPPASAPQTPDPAVPERRTKIALSPPKPQVKVSGQSVSTPVPQDAPKPAPPQVSAPNGIAVGGANYGDNTVVNQGPQPVTVSPEQMSVLTDEMRPYGDVDIIVARSGSSEAVEAAQNSLAQALTAAGLKVDKQDALMYVGPDGKVLANGFTVGFSEDRRPQGAALEWALVHAKLASPEHKIHAFVDGVPGMLFIGVGPP